MQEILSMNGAARETDHPSISSTVAKLSFGAPIVFLILLTALHFIKSEVNPSWHFISEYSIGNSGWMMQLAFLSLAFSLVALVATIKSQIQTRWGKVGLGLLLVVAGAMTAGGLFTIDPITASRNEVTTHGNLHGLASMIGNPGFAAAALLISYSLTRNSAWASVRRLIVWTGSLPLISFVLMLAVLGITMSQAGEFGPDVPIGWPNRLLVISYCVWVMAVAWHAIQLSRQKS